ncbi:uncharacterized protein LOC144748661 [Ciona intestinalis]
MWTTTNLKTENNILKFNPNHFCFLKERSLGKPEEENQIIIISDDSEISDDSDKQENQHPHTEIFIADPETETSIADPETETFIADPETETSIADPETETFSADPETETFIADPETETFIADPETETFIADPETETFSADPETETFIADPQTETFSADPETETFSADPETETFIADPETETFIADPETETFIADPETETFIPDEEHKDSQKQIKQPFTKLPFKDTFLAQHEAIEYLSVDCRKLVEPCIPCGIKENVFILVDNSDNLERAARGKGKVFSDDCGAWIKNSMTVLKSIVQHKNIRTLQKHNGKYCTRNARQNKYTPLLKQPEDNEVITLGYYYSKLKKDQKYKRKITWVISPGPLKVNTKVALVEYIGLFPGNMPHLNSNHGNIYIRTPVSTTKFIKNRVKTCATPKEIYDDLVLTMDATTAPRNLQQIYNKKHATSKTEGKGFNTNYADDILRVINLAQSEEFVQSILHKKDSPVAIILYNEKQISDIVRFCCTGRSVLNVDKTFNLGKIHVTITVYKNRSVKSIKSGNNPLFLGPVFLHNKSDFKTFSFFFTQLGSVIGPHHDKMIFGTDDEQAMHKAITYAFPYCTHILCFKHLRDNLVDYLKDKVGADKQLRKQILQLMDKILDTKNEIDFAVAEFKLIEFCETYCTSLQSYLKERFLVLLRTKVWEFRNLEPIGDRWTNNNAESYNHVIKCKFQWKQKIADIVTTLKSLVDVVH